MARISSGPLTARARSVSGSPSSTARPRGGERAEAGEHDLVDREAAVAAGVGGHDVGDLGGEGGGGGVGRLAGQRVEEGGAGAELGDERVVGGEEGGVLVVPEHHVAVGEHEAGAERVVHVPDLHVGRVGGVADVERVEEQEAAEVAGDDPGHQPVEAPAAERRRGRAATRPAACHSARASAVGPISTRSLPVRRRRVDAAVHGAPRA